MAGARRPEPDRETRSFQEGSRWIGDKPSGEEFAKWFTENVKLHEGMDPEKYVGGIVLISGKEKTKQVNEGGGIVDVERLVHTPYAKVETRVAYFWDLMDKHQDDWVGVIEPVPAPRLSDSGFYNLNLPPGFFRHAVPTPDNAKKFVHFVGCAMRVRILKTNTLGWRDYIADVAVKYGGTLRPEALRELRRLPAEPVREYPPGTKLVPIVDWNRVDTYALMKAETGAVGRALGMAGMLVIPGSGVATAEDMQEALSAGAPTAESEAQLPTDEEKPGGDGAAEAPENANEQMRTRIAELSKRLEDEAPGKMDEIEAWAREKSIDLNEIRDSQLRSVLRKLEQALPD